MKSGLRAGFAGGTRVRGRWLIAAFLASLVLPGCGGDSPSEPGSEGPGISARINGVAWSGATNLSSATFTAASNHLHIGGIPAESGSFAMGITLVDVTGTGQIVLHDSFPLRFAVVTTLQGGSWSSSNEGGSGSVTVTSLTQTRVAGTFSFTAPASGSSAVSGTLTVTEGQFDLPLIRL